MDAYFITELKQADVLLPFKLSNISPFLHLVCVLLRLLCFYLHDCFGVVVLVLEWHTRWRIRTNFMDVDDD